MSDPFDKIFERLLDFEGRTYVNDPDDAGGETKFGISKRAYPDVDIKVLTEPEAKEIYRRDYWNKLKCHALPEDLRETVFDFAVTSGAATSAMTLQSAYNFVAEAYGALRKTKPKRLVVDGIIGSASLAAILALTPQQRGILLVTFNGIRYTHYRNCASKPGQLKFIPSWFRRMVP